MSGKKAKKKRATEEKTLFESKTTWGLLIAFLALVLHQFGIDISELLNVEAISNSLVSSLGVAFAVYGTAKRKSGIKGLC
jgi:hypothetical protein